VSQKAQASHKASECKAFSEYLKNPRVDLGRLLATTRTLIAAWALVALFNAAMLLAPAVIHSVHYADARAAHALHMVLSHEVSFIRAHLLRL